MKEILNILFTNLFILVVLIFIFFLCKKIASIIVNKKQQKLKEGYLKVSNKVFAIIALEATILGTFISLNIIISAIKYKNFGGYLSTIIFMCSLTLMVFIMYFYIVKKVVFFNKDNIIVSGLFKKTTTYSYDEIEKIINVLGDKIICYTSKGKFTVDHYYSNSNKFLAILKEKNLPIEERQTFIKIKP